MTQYQALLDSDEYVSAKKKLLEAIYKKASTLTQVQPSKDPKQQEILQNKLKLLSEQKGREQYFKYLSSGMGNGPYVELLDGSVKLDFIGGIGIHFFGHSHPLLVSEQIDVACSDVLQGNLQPGYEASEFIQMILSLVGKESRLKHGWMFCSGTMSNETALKIIRQKKAPATKFFGFKNSFAGRSTAMQELTDNPKYREGQPTYNEFYHLPFYSEKLSLDENVRLVVSTMKEQMNLHPQAYAGLCLELVQGEGGIHFAPKEWYEKIFDFAKKQGLYIWADEIQTFGRTTELFAYQALGLDAWIDVVTIGKLSQVCMALYTAELNPKPGLVAGTFTGTASAMRVGKKMIEHLVQNHYYGEKGRINTLAQFFVSELNELKNTSLNDVILKARHFGGMIAIDLVKGDMDHVKKILMRFFDKGLIAFYAGHDPYCIRMLPPFGVLDKSHLMEAVSIIKSALEEKDGL